MTARSTLFRPETFDLIAGEFATNLSYYRNYADDDDIAGMFLGCALDIVDCAYYTFAKSLPAEQRKIVGFFVGGWNDDVFGTRLFDDIFDAELAREIIDQHGMLLEALRDKYDWLVRGPRSSCWRESAASIAAGADECRSRPDCAAADGEGGLVARRCAAYYGAWRGTMLALEGKESLRRDPARLAACIRERCRVLALLTTSQSLAEYLDDSYAGEVGEDAARTVRGAIPRLLTMLIDESLADLSRKMNLSPAEALYFAGPSPRGTGEN